MLSVVTNRHFNRRTCRRGIGNSLIVEHKPATATREDDVVALIPVEIHETHIVLQGDGFELNETAHQQNRQSILLAILRQSASE